MTARQPPLVPTGSKEDILVSIHGLEGQGSFRAAKAFLNFSTYLYELVLFFFTREDNSPTHTCELINDALHLYWHLASRQARSTNNMMSVARKRLAADGIPLRTVHEGHQTGESGIFGMLILTWARLGLFRH